VVPFGCLSLQPVCAEKVPAYILIRIESLIDLFLGQLGNSGAAFRVLQDLVHEKRHNRLHRIGQGVVDGLNPLMLIDHKIGNHHAGAKGAYLDRPVFHFLGERFGKVPEPPLGRSIDCVARAQHVDL